MPKPVIINGETVTDHELTCPECGNSMELRPSRFGLFYCCSTWSKTKCNGSHGARLDGTPHGIPANQETKQARRAAHHVFDHLWKEGHMSRGASYRWMQTVMVMSEGNAHIGRFTKPECKQLVLAFKETYPDIWKQIRREKA